MSWENRERSAQVTGDTTLVPSLVISCNAYDAVLNLECFVYPLSYLASGNLVESSFGYLHNEVPLHELCVELWCCHFKQFHIRKIHRSPSSGCKIMENNILTEVGFMTFKITFIFKIMDGNTAHGFVILRTINVARICLC